MQKTQIGDYLDRKPQQYLKYLLLLSLFFTWASCGQKPESCFGYTQKGRPKNSALLTGIPISFTNCTPEGKSFTWNFGDGNTNTDKNPEHIYNEPGSYIVTLKVRNQGKRSSTSQVLTLFLPALEDSVSGKWTLSKLSQVNIYENNTRDTLNPNYTPTLWYIDRNGSIHIDGFPDTFYGIWRIQNRNLIISDKLYLIKEVTNESLKLKYTELIHTNTMELYFTFIKQ